MTRLATDEEIDALRTAAEAAKRTMLPFNNDIVILSTDSVFALLARLDAAEALNAAAITHLDLCQGYAFGDDEGSGF